MMSRGPISDDIHELELELELLKRKRLMIQQQQQMLAGEKYTQQRQHYEQPQPMFNQSYGLSQNQDAQFNFSHLYSNPQPSGSKFSGNQSTGQKRQANDLWQPNQPKRFNSGPKGKAKNFAQPKTLPTPWASNSNVVQPLLAYSFSSPKPQGYKQKQTKQKQTNYQKPKFQKPAPIKTPPTLNNTPEPKPQNLQPKTEENASSTNPYKKPTKQQIGKLEFVLGSILKDMRKAYSQSDLYSVLFRNNNTLRALKQSIRDRLYSAMANKVTAADKATMLYDKYRQIYPKETDVEIMDIALKVAKAIINHPTLAINIEAEESPEAFFKKNIDKLLYAKISEMLEKMQKAYEEENNITPQKRGQQKINYPQTHLYHGAQQLIDENLSFINSFQVKSEGNGSAIQTQDKTDDNSSAPEKLKEKSGEKDTTLESQKEKSENNDSSHSQEPDKTGSSSASEKPKENSGTDTALDNEIEKSCEIGTTLETQKDNSGEKDTAVDNQKGKSNENDTTVNKEIKNENDIVVDTKVNPISKNESENDNATALDDTETQMIFSAWKSLNIEFFRPSYYIRMLNLLLPHAFARVLPQCKDEILKILQTDSQFVYTKQEIERRTSNLPSFNADGSQTETYKYYAKICGIPMLPLKQNMKRFLHKYNPALVKKHKKFGHLLFVGFNNKENFDELLKADGTSLGLIKLKITVSDYKPEKNENGNAQTIKTNDQEAADDTENIISKELDDKITDLLTSIREAEEAERDGKEHTNEVEFVNEQREVISLIDEEMDEAGKSKVTDDVQVEHIEKSVNNNKDNEVIKENDDATPEDVEMAPQAETGDRNGLSNVLEEDETNEIDDMNPTGELEL